MVVVHPASGGAVVNSLWACPHPATQSLTDMADDPIDELTAGVDRARKLHADGIGTPSVLPLFDRLHDGTVVTREGTVLSKPAPPLKLNTEVPQHGPATRSSSS